MNCSTIQFINTNTNPQTIIAFKTLKCINAAEDPKNSRINAIPPRVYPPRHADKRLLNICWQGTDLHVYPLQISRVSEGYPARTHSCWSAPFNQDQIKIIKIKSRSIRPTKTAARSGFFAGTDRDRAGQAVLYLCNLKQTKSVMFQHISIRRISHPG